MMMKSLSPFYHFKRYKRQLFKLNRQRTIDHHLFLCAVYQPTLYLPLQDLLAQINRYLMSAASKPIKQDNTSSLFSLQFANYHWVVKRYNFRGWGGLFKRCFRISRARRNWINATLLEQLSIQAIKPLAFLEHRFLCFRMKSYFVAEYIDGERLNDYFMRETDANEKALIADRVIALLKQLATHAIHHGDLKATNLLLHKGIPRLLDLDAMRFHPNPQHKRFKQKFTKDIDRFMRNWLALPEVHQLFRERLSLLTPYITINQFKEAL